MSLADPATWLALLSLTAMEIVLGIDNIVFITVLTSRLPEGRRARVSRIGLVLALGMRVALLFALRWIMGLTEPLFSVWSNAISGRDLILLVGGLFLIAKATTEIYGKVEKGDHEAAEDVQRPASETSVLLQVVALDVVFSLDSVITAVGMVPPDQIWIMITAVILSIVVMLVFARRIGEFVMRHPSIKVLALSFLVLIGVLLVADGLGEKIPKGYVYFAMGFSLAVELINMRFRRKRAEEAKTAAAAR